MMRIARAARALLRVPMNAAHAVREQADREEFARIDASLEGPRGAPPAIRQADPQDPLELLWNLRAMRPESAR